MDCSQNEKCALSLVVRTLFFRQLPDQKSLLTAEYTSGHNAKQAR